MERVKLYIGGLSLGTEKDALYEHFSKYGKVKDAFVIRKGDNGIVRKFGFVEFFDVSLAEKALQENHVIRGKTVDVRIAAPRFEQHHNMQHQYKTKKIFVGGLSAKVTDDDFKNYFEKFGNITDVVVIDDSTGRRRGFGFITFDSEEAVDSVMRNNFHVVKEKTVEVKRAIPKERIGYNYNDNNSKNRRNGYNNGVFAGRDSDWSNHYIYFPFYSPPNYGYYGPVFFHGYADSYPYAGSYPYGATTFGGYSHEDYSGVSYGNSTGSPWYTGRSMSPYGNSGIYPAYMTSVAAGYMDATAGGYYDLMRPISNEDQNQDVNIDMEQMVANTLEGQTADNDSSGITGNYDVR
ncbi:hypothetical protein IFM89_020246 [Coptis chinensis]|uniref:RRM domain-containing protein n=1 Tax=Coptis chinensis TaxID=261450 RepID=A0A835LS62_9MAGN|nr:hypothetical protein IFM89_020246 [Coptis chinensis]